MSDIRHPGLPQTFGRIDPIGVIAVALAALSPVTVSFAQPARIAPAEPVLTLEAAIEAAAGDSAPGAAAAAAQIAAARAGRVTAGLRPNPTLQAEIENVAGTGAYSGFSSAETTVGVAFPIELGGKRGARIAVADAQLSRARIEAAVARADIRFQVQQLYVEAVAAERRLTIAREQVGIAQQGLRAAEVRVRAGRASPLEQERANVTRINAEASAQRMERLSDAARLKLARRIDMSIGARLDTGLLERLVSREGPVLARSADGTLALAAAEADVAIADAGVRLSRANRMPDIEVGPGLRRLEATNDTAAVFSLSIPIPVFNTGRAALDQARAEQTRAEAQRRIARLDAEQAITDADTEVANALTTAEAGKASLAAAQEAARIARIGYREGKFGQLDLLDAERTLGETRTAQIDAQAAYHIARARLERLTSPAPVGGAE